MTARDLAARRRLLAAKSVLQRVRLAHDVHTLRQACRPTRWTAVTGIAGMASVAAALGVALRLHARTRRAAPVQTAAPGWALRALTLWRAARVLRRVWRASRPLP